MLQNSSPLQFKTQQVFSQTKMWMHRNWIKIFSLVLLAYVLIHKDLNFQLNLNGANSSPVTTQFEEIPSHEIETESVKAVPATHALANTGASILHAVQKDDKKKQPKKTSKKPIDDNVGNTYSNMTYTFDKSTKKNYGTKRKKQEAYVKRFALVAKAEMEKYGIPASIILAQGLIETNAGESKLSVRNNNHFGMKCFSKKCRKGHCSNFTDDSHKDFFRKYKSAWESYRAHSHLLNGKRYKHLKKLGTKDYKGWAKGLRKAGYATDKRYAEKLINLIETLKLDKFDQTIS